MAPVLFSYISFELSLILSCSNEIFPELFHSNGLRPLVCDLSWWAANNSLPPHLFLSRHPQQQPPLAQDLLPVCTGPRGSTLTHQMPLVITRRSCIWIPWYSLVTAQVSEPLSAAQWEAGSPGMKRVTWTSNVTLTLKDFCASTRCREVGSVRIMRSESSVMNVQVRTPNQALLVIRLFLFRIEQIFKKLCIKLFYTVKYLQLLRFLRL